MKNLTKIYGKGNTLVKALDDVSFEVEQGEFVAIIGPSGSGKSTIAKLIAGFWDVTEGNITLGGKDIKEIPLDQLNQEIAYVSQDNYLFDRTIRDNIRMGKLNATDAEVEAVAKAAGCEVHLTVYDEMFHVFQLGMKMMKESRNAWKEIEEFLNC